MSRVLLQEMTWPEVQKKIDSNILEVLLPIGSTEQHGPHMPLGVDTYIPMWAAEQVAHQTGTPVAPPLWYAPCEHHMGFPGTISLRSSTMMNILFDMCSSLRRHGFREFIILNGHTSGANPVLLTAIDEIQRELKDVRVWIVDVVLMARDAVFGAAETDILYHADEVEAAQMLVARPDLVWLDKAEKIEPVPQSPFMPLGYRGERDQILWRHTPEEWKTLTHLGNIGDPTAATVEKGQKMMNGLVENVVSFVKERRAFIQSGN